MGDLIEYKNSYLVYPFGLYNNSVLCYFNSLIQSLLSCTSISEYLLNNEEKFKSNTFIKLYISLIKKYIVNDHKSNFLVDNINLLLFNEFLQKIKISKRKFGYDQEDSGELLLLLLEIINDKFINELFLHKFKCDIYCKECKHIINIANDTNIFFEVNLYEIKHNYLKYEVDKHLSDINKYIRNNYSDLENYTCQNCKNQNCIKINRLTLTPSIIVINLNKYKNKYDYQYPLELIFINKNAKIKYNYKIISTINHSGNQNFGHYISKSIRKNHEYCDISDKEYDIYLLNDTSYEKNNFKSDANSYLLFYHFVESIEYYE